MSQEVIKKVQKQFEKKRPEVSVGDTVVVHTVIRDGDKKRIQKFQGIVIAIKGAGTDKMFTVRKISYGIGVEKIFPVNSPNVDKIEILKHSTVRRAKLYYMRGRIGKAAMKLKLGDKVEAYTEEEVEPVNEEAVAETETKETPEESTN